MRRRGGRTCSRGYLKPHNGPRKPSSNPSCCSQAVYLRPFSENESGTLTKSGPATPKCAVGLLNLAIISDSNVRSSWCPPLSTSAGCMQRDRLPLHLALSLSLPLVIVLEVALLAVLDTPSDRVLLPYRLSSNELAWLTEMSPSTDKDDDNDDDDVVRELVVVEPFDFVAAAAVAIACGPGVIPSDHLFSSSVVSNDAVGADELPTIALLADRARPYVFIYLCHLVEVSLCRSNLG